MKILLIAKPWKGGLGRYYYAALETLYPGNVTWLSTRPTGLAEHIAYQHDTRGWWNKLRDRIATTPCDAALFIGFHKNFVTLPYRANNILYMVDAISPEAGRLNAFARIYYSDPGYQAELHQACDMSRVGGVVGFACHPPLHHPPLHHSVSSGAASLTWDRQRDVCFIGNRDRKRDPYVARLLAVPDLRVTVVGNYFMRDRLFWQKPLAFRPAVSNEAMGDLYAGHKISVNIHAAVVREGTNMRSFEAAAYHKPQVIEARPGLERYFEPEREILTYRDGDEMIVQIDRLRRDPEFAQQLAARAHHRAYAEHTYQHRVQQLLAGL